MTLKITFLYAVAMLLVVIPWAVMVFGHFTSTFKDPHVPRLVLLDFPPVAP